MPSRMDRYYRNEKITPSRTTKNKNLYRTIYDNTDYSNVDSIAKNLNNGQIQEIDFSMIQELLKEKEQIRKPRPSIEKELESIKREEPVEDDRNYDIRDILNKAKDNRETDEKDNKKIRNIEYDILKNINIEQTKKEESKNDINDTSVLTNLNNEDLSLNLLDDLKSENNTMIGSNDSIHHILEEVKKEENKEKEEDNIDKSFFTSSLNFTQEDFEDEEEYVQKNKKSNLGLKITLAALIIATILIIALVVMKVFIK